MAPRSIGRRTYVITAIAVSTLLVLAASCGSSTTNTAGTGGTVATSSTSENIPPEPPDTSTKKVFKADDTPIKVVVGEKFGIRLDENPSIGDSWQVISQPDPSYLKDEGNSYKSDSAEPMPGSGGQREFKYKARAPGTTTIVFYNCYRCGSSSTVSPENSALAKRLTYTVTVS